MDTQKEVKVNIDEHLLKEAKGDYGVETSPGVYYFYSNSGDLVSTVRVRGDHYTIKYRGNTRANEYAKRGEYMAKLKAEEVIFSQLAEEVVEVKPELPRWV